MKRANRFMLVIGVALAALSFVAVLALGGLNQAPGQLSQAPDVPVVVAAADIPLGTQISAEQLTTATRPESETTDTYRHPEELVGKVARRGVTTAQALSPSDFETSVSVPDIVRSLRPGLRAIALPLSTVDAVGSLLQSGDFVDVLVSLREDDLLNPIVVPNPNAGSVGNSNVSLVLRSPADYAVGDVPTTGITLKELVEMYGVLPPQPVTL